jgi:hypothetical protein
MKKKSTSAQHRDRRGNALYGALVGIVVASLHDVQHVLTNQISDNTAAHVLGEFIIAACGGAILFAVASAIADASKARRDFA